MRPAKLFVFCGIWLRVAAANAQALDITSFGAVGDGTTVNTAAIQAAVDSCSQAGGGVVEVPAGNFITGTIFLKSKVTIHIAQNGTITGSSNLADYPDVHPVKRTYTDNYPQKSVFYAEGQHDIAITGEGTFNGNGQSVNFLLNQSNRPLGFRFFSCTNVRYEGLHLRHSGFWMMHNFDIDTLIIKNLDIVNQGFGNNDGINMDGCRHVLVDSCFADCNDDPLVIKTSSPIGCSDIEIKHCTVATYSRALKIGSETNGPVSHVYLHDCVVQLSTNGPFGSSTPASCGINLSMVDGGSMDNVVVENVVMSGINTPFFIRLGNRARKYADTAAVPGVGSVANLVIRNVTATASSNISSSVTGIPNYRIGDVLLQNIDVTFPGGWPALSNNFTVPENETGKPDADMFGDSLPAAGLYSRHVDSLVLEQVCFHALQPDARPAVYAEDVVYLDSSAVCVPSRSGSILPGASLTLFPNPVTTVLHVQVPDLFGSGMMKLYDASGQLLMTRKSAPALTVDMRERPAGLYFLQISGPSVVVTRSFVKP